MFYIVAINDQEKEIIGEAATLEEAKKDILDGIARILDEGVTSQVWYNGATVVSQLKASFKHRFNLEIIEADSPDFLTPVDGWAADLFRENQPLNIVDWHSSRMGAGNLKPFRSLKVLEEDLLF